MRMLRWTRSSFLRKFHLKPNTNTAETSTVRSTLARKGNNLSFWLETSFSSYTLIKYIEFTMGILLKLFSAFGKLWQIDFRSDFRSKNDFFRNFFPDSKSATEITFTQNRFKFNVGSV